MRIWFLAIALSLIGCRKETRLSQDSGYPERVNKIVQTNCAVESCHTTNGKIGAAGLSLETWSDMFNGGNSGSVVVPFRADMSLVHLYSNTYPELGLSLSPTMPINAPPLDYQSILVLKNWIENGAPSKDGQIAFSAPHADKFYVVNQGCDEVAVIDAATLLVSRYIKVGVTNAIEAPHAIKISADRKFAYVAFALGSIIQKIDCVTDRVIGSVDIGFGLWNSLAISSDGQYIAAVDWQPNGKLVILNTHTMSVINTLQGLSNAHGIAATPDFTTLYCTMQPGNKLYKIDISNLQTPELSSVIVGSGSPDPHDIIFSPDGSRYFVTCQSSNEVKIFNTENDNIVATLQTAQFPQELALSSNYPYIFVSCTNEPSSTPKTKGAVQVFNYNTLQLVKTFSQGFYQPHGLAVNDAQNIVLVANRNLESSGPAPHHSGSCSGRNGFVKAIDLSTLELIQSYKHEISVDPYNIASR